MGPKKRGGPHNDSDLGESNRCDEQRSEGEPDTISWPKSRGSSPPAVEEEELLAQGEVLGDEALGPSGPHKRQQCGHKGHREAEQRGHLPPILNEDRDVVIGRVVRAKRPGHIVISESPPTGVSRRWACAPKGLSRRVIHRGECEHSIDWESRSLE